MTKQKMFLLKVKSIQKKKKKKSTVQTIRGH